MQIQNHRTGRMEWKLELIISLSCRPGAPKSPIIIEENHPRPRSIPQNCGNSAINAIRNRGEYSVAVATFDTYTIYKRPTCVMSTVPIHRLPINSTLRCPKTHCPLTNTISATYKHLRVVTCVRIGRFSQKESIVLPTVTSSWLVLSIPTL
jgi:hypothetical protein